MKGLVVKLGTLLALALALNSTAAAQELRPLLDAQRFSVGLGADVEWYKADPAPPLERDLTGSLRAAYVVTPHLALTGFGAYGVKNRVWQAGPEVRWRFELAGEALSVAVGYQFLGGDSGHLPAVRNEWTVGALYGRRLFGPVIGGVGVRYGLDSNILRPAFGIRVPLHVGKDS